MFNKLALVGAVAGLAQVAVAQSNDTIWHNRYHAILSMSAYGDYNNLCPQVFTRDSMLANFPDSDFVPWEVIETFGPTPSGAEGYVVMIREMDKVVIVFKGDYILERQLNDTVASWDALGLGAGTCDNCSVNAFALQGYLEARAETNNWAIARQRAEETGLETSITGHGLGGMHSLLASVDLGWAGICRWSHNYGTPRTFNAAGAAFYNRLFQGEAGERGVANNDGFPEIIPQGPNYEHTNTAFYYDGYSATYQMNMHICRDQPEDDACAPRTPYRDADHYFYFSNVGQCGQGRWREVREDNEAFISSELSAFRETSTASLPAVNATAAATSTSINSTASSTAISTSAPASTVTGGIAGANNAALPNANDVSAASSLQASLFSASAVFGAAVLAFFA